MTEDIEHAEERILQELADLNRDQAPILAEQRALEEKADAAERRAADSEREKGELPGRAAAGEDIELALRTLDDDIGHQHEVAVTYRAAAAAKARELEPYRDRELELDRARRLARAQPPRHAYHQLAAKMEACLAEFEGLVESLGQALENVKSTHKAAYGEELHVPPFNIMVGNALSHWARGVRVNGVRLNDLALRAGGVLENPGLHRNVPMPE